MSPALRPEVRVDRNGVPVRRWVRERPLAASLPAVPQHLLRQPMGKDERDKRAYIQYQLSRACSSPSDEMPAVIDRLIDYSKETIELIHDSLGIGPSRVYYSEAVSLISDYGEERTVREYMALSTAITECEDLRATIAYINGLSAYGCFDVDDLSTLDEGEGRLAVALLRTAFHLSCADEVAHAAEAAGDPLVIVTDDCNTIADPDLLAVFLDHPERAEDLWEFISRAPGNYRRIDDLRELAASTPRALQRGFL